MAGDPADPFMFCSLCALISAWKTFQERPLAKKTSLGLAEWCLKPSFGAGSSRAELTTQLFCTNKCCRQPPWPQALFFFLILSAVKETQPSILKTNNKSV